MWLLFVAGRNLFLLVVLLVFGNLFPVTLCDMLNLEKFSFCPTDTESQELPRCVGSGSIYLGRSLNIIILEYVAQLVSSYYTKLLV